MTRPGTWGCAHGGQMDGDGDPTRAPPAEVRGHIPDPEASLASWAGHGLRHFSQAWIGHKGNMSSKKGFSGSWAQHQLENS